MSFNAKESILAYWEMLKFFGVWALMMGIVYLIAKEIR